MPRLPGPDNLAAARLGRDPGVRVPETGLQGLGRAMQGVGTGIAESVQAAMERQQKRNDVIGKSEALLRYQQDTAEDLRRFQTEADPADPKAYEEFQKRRASRMQETVKAYQDRLSADALAELQATLNGQLSSALKYAGTVHLSAQQNRALSLLDEQIATMARQAEQYPNQLEDLLYQGSRILQDHQGILTPEQEEEVRADLEGRLIGNGVRGWIKSQDPLTAVRRLEAGDMPPTLKGLWETLAPEERDSLRKQVITETSEMITLENKIAARREKETREAMDRIAVEFYTTDDPETRERLGRFLLAIETDPQKVRQVKDYLQEAGAFGEDNAAAVLTLESRIRGGEIRSPEEAIAYLGNGVSADTMRTRIFPQIEAMQDEEFRRSSEWLGTVLGIPPNTLIGDLNQDVARRVSTAQAQLLEFRQANPNGDFWQEAQKIAERVKSEQKTTAELRLPFLVQQYREALRNDDIDQAERLQLVIQGIPGGEEAIRGIEIPEREEDRGFWSWWPF